MEHILLHCKIAWKIWSFLLNWWGFSFCCPKDLTSLFNQWRSLVSGKLQSKFWIIIFFATSWSLWLARNDTIFNDNSFTFADICATIFHRAVSWFKCFYPTITCSGLELVHNVDIVKSWHNPIRFRPNVLWQPPPLNVLKWNTDGSSIGKPGQSGIGGILRSHLGSFMCLFSCPIGIADSNEAELRASLQAIRITSQQTSLLRTALGIIIESDSRISIS